ncbi:transposase [Nocardioides massiliensis]|uniref:transposase n=2 Tax=Nocardioides massiliensis TaxID=1325935 RepID=UPI0027D80A0B|nr:transposase [Nocardioides massiliensis]
MQAGRLGQPKRRNQTCGRHQVRIIEDGPDRVRGFHLRGVPCSARNRVCGNSDSLAQQGHSRSTPRSTLHPSVDQGSANRSADWVRQQAQRVAAEVVAEAEQTDAREDAEDDSDRLPPQFANRKDRAASIKKALDELDRRRGEEAEQDQADRVRAEQILARAATEAMPGPVPAGVDPVAYHRARISRFQRLLAENETAPGQTAARVRFDARKALERAEQALNEAEAASAAGEVDLRGPRRRARDRRTARARARGGQGEVVNTTDPESRLMTEGAGGGSVQGYNAQIAVSDDHFIAGIHVSQEANDTGCFTPTLNEVTAQVRALDKQIDLVLADAGYFTDDNLTTTGPERLIAPGKSRDLHADAARRPATGPRSEEVSVKDAMRHRLRQPQNVERYKRRSATVEPVIAHLKEQVGLRRFAQRGLAAVTAELHLAAAVVNLTRLHRAQAATG